MFQQKETNEWKQKKEEMQHAEDPNEQTRKERVLRLEEIVPSKKPIRKKEETSTWEDKKGRNKHEERKQREGIYNHKEAERQQRVIKEWGEKNTNANSEKYEAVQLRTEEDMKRDGVKKGKHYIKKH